MQALASDGYLNSAPSSQVLTFAGEPGRLSLLGALTFCRPLHVFTNSRSAGLGFEQQVVMEDVIFRHRARPAAGAPRPANSTLSLLGLAMYTHIRSVILRPNHHHGLTLLIFRRESHLVAGEFQYDCAGPSCGSEIQHAPIDGDLPRADS
jgi:hypothetical protein